MRRALPAAPSHRLRLLILGGIIVLGAVLVLTQQLRHIRPTGSPPDPPEWIALNEDGLARFQRAEYDGALASFGRALELDPTNETLRKNMAQAHGALGWEAIGHAEFVAARSQFENAIRLFDGEASHHIGLALGLYRLKKDEDALKALEVALRLNPDDQLANSIEGDIRYERNEFGRAMAAWETALRSDPHDRTLTARIEKLRNEYGRLSALRHEGSPRFRVLFEGREEHALQGHVLDLLEDAYQTIGQELGYYPDRPISAVLYTNEQFRDITRTPGWTKGLFDGKIHLPLGGPLDDETALRKVITHELTHAFIAQLGGDRVPTWLHEGLAQWFEDPEHRHPRIAGPITPLNQLHGSFLAYDEVTAQRAYAQSLAVTASLIERYGLFRITHFLGTLPHASSFDQAFESAYLESYPDFETAWVTSVESSGAPVPAE